MAPDEGDASVEERREQLNGDPDRRGRRRHFSQASELAA